MKRKFTDPIVWTHLLFVLNAMLWFYVEAYVCSFFLLLSTVASTGYHRLGEGPNVWQKPDKILAVVTLLVTLAVTFPRASWADLLNAVLLLAMALIAKKQAEEEGKYKLWHSLWHVLVSIGQAYLVWVYRF